jgi:cell division transport system ATP-binding protein
MIRFEAVSKIYKGDFPALENINLEIQDGEFVSIVGASGAGKSTLLKLIYAEEMPTSGVVYFEEIPTSSISRSKLPFFRRSIGTIFQDFKLLHRKTAFENVAFALEVSGVPQPEIDENVPQILEIVGLGGKMDKYPKQLSVGEQQRVSLARALIHRPKVIVADEPTGNLDPVSSWEIVKLLLKINELGTTVILASHDQYVIDKAGKRVIVMENGKIIGDSEKGKYKLT